MFQCFKYPGYPTTVNPGTPTPTSTQPPGTNDLRFCQSAIILNIIGLLIFYLFLQLFLVSSRLPQCRCIMQHQRPG